MLTYIYCKQTQKHPTYLIQMNLGSLKTVEYEIDPKQDKSKIENSTLCLAGIDNFSGMPLGMSKICQLPVMINQRSVFNMLSHFKVTPQLISLFRNISNPKDLGQNRSLFVFNGRKYLFDGESLYDCTVEIDASIKIANRFVSKESMKTGFLMACEPLAITTIVANSIVIPLHLLPKMDSDSYVPFEICNLFANATDIRDLKHHITFLSQRKIPIWELLKWIGSDRNLSLESTGTQMILFLILLLSILYDPKERSSITISDIMDLFSYIFGSDINLANCLIAIQCLPDILCMDGMSLIKLKIY